MNGMRLKSKFICVRFDILIVTEDSCCRRCDAVGH